MIGSFTITVPSDRNAYIFQLELSALALDRLRHYRLFGLFNIQKSKYQFLNDLRDVITEELMGHFERITDNET